MCYNFFEIFEFREHGIFNILILWFLEAFLDSYILDKKAVS